MFYDKCGDCPLEKSGYPKEQTFEAASKYKPEAIKILFIAESPPSKKEGAQYKYFYFVNEAKPGSLYREMMKAIFKREFNLDKSKSCFLKKFQDKGFFLVDAAKCSVDNLSKQRASVIAHCANSYLIDEIKELNPEGIILIKKNVFEIIPPLLPMEIRSKILNPSFIPFPGSGQQLKFQTILGEILSQ